MPLSRDFEMLRHLLVLFCTVDDESVIDKRFCSLCIHSFFGELFIGIKLIRILRLKSLKFMSNVRLKLHQDMRIFCILVVVLLSDVYLHHHYKIETLA